MSSDPRMRNIENGRADVYVGDEQVGYVIRQIEICMGRRLSPNQQWWEARTVDGAQIGDEFWYRTDAVESFHE